MGVPERKAREKEELREQILAAACELFNKQGYEAVTMRKIAERIEYSPTTLYLYFRDKTDLFDNICADTFAKLVARLRALKERASDPVEGLRLGLRCYIDFGLEHPAHYRVTFMTPPHSGYQCPTRSQEIGDSAFECLREGVRACIATGAFPNADVETTSQMLWTAIHGITSLLITGTGFPWVEREPLINHLLDTLMRGLRTS